jgi:hypothetical protein
LFAVDKKIYRPLVVIHHPPHRPRATTGVRSPAPAQTGVRVCGRAPTTESLRGDAVNKKIRTLTVSSLYRAWGEPHRKCECVVPSIRLNGKWLAALGVEPGQKIRVITNGATITLAPISFESGELTSIARPKSAVLQP